MASKKILKDKKKKKVIAKPKKTKKTTKITSAPSRRASKKRKWRRARRRLSITGHFLNSSEFGFDELEQTINVTKAVVDFFFELGKLVL